MKLSKVSGAAILAMSLLLAGSVFAAEKTSIQIHEAVHVGGKILPKGEYTLQWEGSGSNVEVNFLKGKEVVATTQGRIVEMQKESNGSGITTKAADDGSRVLSEIHFRGKKASLELGDAQSAEVK